MTEGNTIKLNNTDVNGNVIGGHYVEIKLSIEPNPQALIAALNRIKDNPHAEDIQDFIDDLDYLTNQHPDAVIGLEGKLKNGGRDDLIEEAIIRKDAFVKKICKGQTTTRRQYIYYYALKKIEAAFNSKIRALIKAQVPDAAIDIAIYEQIIELIYSEICPSDVSIDQFHIYGMMYFLTGKCWIKWNK